MSSFFRSRHFVFGVIACVDVCFLLAEKERCQSAEEVLLKELCVLCDSAFKTSTRNFKILTQSRRGHSADTCENLRVLCGSV